MFGFLVIITIVFAFVGGSIGYFRNEEKNISKRIFDTFAGIIITVLVIGAITSAIFFDLRADIIQYNGGICPICGGQYQLVSGYHREFHYECNKCYHSITTSTKMK